MLRPRVQMFSPPDMSPGLDSDMLPSVTSPFLRSTSSTMQVGEPFLGQQQDSIASAGDRSLFVAPNADICRPRIDSSATAGITSTGAYSTFSEIPTQPLLRRRSSSKPITIASSLSQSFLKRVCIRLVGQAIAPKSLQSARSPLSAPTAGGSAPAATAVHTLSKAPAPTETSTSPDVFGEFGGAGVEHAAPKDPMLDPVLESGDTRFFWSMQDFISEYDRSSLIGSNAHQSLWISVDDASLSDIELLGTFFGLHPLTIEDTQSTMLREKIEAFSSEVLRAVNQQPHQQSAHHHHHHHHHRKINESYLFVSLHLSHGITPTIDGKRHQSPISDKISVLRCVMWSNCIITFASDAQSKQAIDFVRSKLKRLYRNHLPSVPWLLHAILDSIVDMHIPIVTHLNQHVDDIEAYFPLITELSQLNSRPAYVAQLTDELVVSTLAAQGVSSFLMLLTQAIRGQDIAAHRQKQLLRLLNTIGNSMSIIKQQLWTKRDLCSSLLQRDWLVVLASNVDSASEQSAPYFRDIYDHLVVMINQLDAALELLDSLSSTFQASISIDVSHAATQTNEAMRKLTAAATILMPISFVGGLFGMNVMVPFQQGVSPPPTTEQLIPFITLCIIMLGIALAVWSWLRKHNLI